MVLLVISKWLNFQNRLSVGDFKNNIFEIELAGIYKVSENH